MTTTRSMKDMWPEVAESLLLPAESVKLNRLQLFNKITGGFRPNEFSILCGATGVGKTTLCANWSACFVDEKVPHYIASVETGPHDYVRRVLSVYANRDWNNGERVEPEDFDAVFNEHEEKLVNEYTRVSIYEDRFGVDTLMADIDREIAEHGIKIAIIDNLNFFLDAHSDSSAIQEMDRVVHKLIIFCKTRPIHMIMVMHPRKTDNGRVMSEYDVKGSSTAIQEAHNVFLFNRAGQDLIDDNYAIPNDRELMIAKMRRRGKYVRSRLVLRTTNGVKYVEERHVE